MNTELMRSTLEASEAGKFTFPQVIEALTGGGVESYFANLVRGEHTFYMPDGATHVEKMKLPSNRVADDFSQSGVIAAIRAAQADEIRYPEFLRRAVAAGTAAYWVFITGERVIYFGRKGEFHIEQFPGSKS